MDAPPAIPLWKRVLKSAIFWDVVIVAVCVLVFGQGIISAITEMAIAYIVMIVLGLILGSLMLWGMVRAMNPRRRNDGDEP
tara:strand:+ start:602 stop:844 length:243 start_codon:yes stop_codon:yes gene_type:complete